MKLNNYFLEAFFSVSIWVNENFILLSQTKFQWHLFIPGRSCSWNSVMTNLSVQQEKLASLCYFRPCHTEYETYNTGKNIVISPDFLVWRFCGKAKFPRSFRWIAQNYAETVPFRKISTPGNQMKLRYFSQCKSNQNSSFQISSSFWIETCWNDCISKTKW